MRSVSYVVPVFYQGYTMTGTRQSYFITKYKLMYSNSDGRYFKSYTNASSNNSEYHPMVWISLTSNLLYYPTLYIILYYIILYYIILYYIILYYIILYYIIL